MPDGYDKDRDNVDNNTRGRVFENGTDRFFRDRENGYVQQSRRFVTDAGRTKFDKIRESDGHTDTIEEKSGRVDTDKDVKQLEVVRAILEKDENHKHILRTVEGEFISKDVQVLIKDLKERFPDQFTHQVISREDAREIWARGLEREPAPQLELPGVREQAREQKERQREARQQNREREERARVEREAAARVAREFPSLEDLRTREDNRDKAKPPAVAKERADPTPKTKDVREREETQAREMVDNLGLNLSDAQKEQLQAILREGRENQREDVAREIETTRGQPPPTPPPTSHRTPEHERDNARAVAREAGVSPEIMGILGLNTNATPPMIDADQARTHAEAERDRSKHQQLERERAARAERDSRYRGE